MLSVAEQVAKTKAMDWSLSSDLIALIDKVVFAQDVTAYDMKTLCDAGLTQEGGLDYEFTDKGRMMYMMHSSLPTDFQRRYPDLAIFLQHEAFKHLDPYGKSYFYALEQAEAYGLEGVRVQMMYMENNMKGDTPPEVRRRLNEWIKFLETEEAKECPNDQTD